VVYSNSLADQAKNGEQQKDETVKSDFIRLLFLAAQAKKDNRLAQDNAKGRLNSASDYA